MQAADARARMRRRPRPPQVLVEQLPDGLQVLQLANCCLVYEEPQAGCAGHVEPQQQQQQAGSALQQLQQLSLTGVRVCPRELRRLLASARQLTCLALTDLPLPLAALAPALEAPRGVTRLSLQHRQAEPHEVLRAPAFSWLRALRDLRELVLYVRGLVGLSNCARAEVEAALRCGTKLRRVDFVAGDVARWL